ncbi:MAG: aminotransferase class I/II-fold pyridoxal phosphate-dependent enzyme [Coriobacteriia bacterium]|nr:aminotransferase class I/II-fold pyridoxal phosphate-dependent enzyme [Coriobacteriia bacterium]MCL2746765.1 aminotransferase class I/II-fold pyridoxal phosphate-dependent enzyme [Coriobacteriia bacterium]MCL2871091.1 aminotransferase class I/II-fold pyridoxal phosphate-dependent enzyme [Coriobacteriia bacterium]
MKSFASDNYSGAHPEVLRAVVQASDNHVPSYGEDPYTEEATDAFRKQFGSDVHVQMLFNGTAANILCLSALMKPWDGVIAAKTAHINTDECGAPERVAGIKVIPVDTENGKLTIEAIAPIVEQLQGFEHARQPKVISISNVAELGTLYSPEETRILAEYAHSKGMYLHVDGARLANAAAALDVSLAALTSEAGVDALSLGGTKNGMLYGDAALWFGGAAKEVKAGSFMLCKASSMLGSKMRFQAVQFHAMYAGTLWRECANQANAMAKRLAAGLPKDCKLAFVEKVGFANEVFAHLPKNIISPLQERFHFYTWEVGEDNTDVVRWVTSWDTKEEEVDALLDAIRTSIEAVA